ncbi:MAG: AraC family transcriptional regulator [Spirochaetia bacterium]|nr:AraC family transcriptional regulator [Spirochaetia bacterium]
MTRQFYFDVDRRGYQITGLYAGAEECRPGHLWEGVRSHHLFHLVVKGRGRVWRDDAVYELAPGDGFMIYPGDNVHYQASRENPWHYTWLGFTGNHVDELLREGGITRTAYVVRGLPMPETAAILKDILDFFPERKAGHFIHATGLAYRFVGMLVDHGKKKPSPRPHSERKKEYVERVKDFMELHYGKKISIAQLADSVGLERSYLSTLFKKETGESLNDCLIRIRMEKAKELLRAGKLNVSEISFSVGYGDLFAFSKRFKKTTGKTPKEFRG